MTNGREKSDPAIVAVRPTNEAERSGSEPAEPRAGAEGNAGQHSTRRAQDRESVSQALERIRQAARQRKKEKFTALFHHLTVDLLEEAFGALAQDAAAGVDGLTWTEYATCPVPNGTHPRDFLPRQRSHGFLRAKCESV